MSDPRGHDHLPDQAALDELLRAFSDPGDQAVPATTAAPPAADDDRTDRGDDVDSDGDRGRDDRDGGSEGDDVGVGVVVDGDDARPLDEGDDDRDRASGERSDEHDDFVLVDRGDASVDPEPTPPSLIRIDDLAGSVVIERTPPARDDHDDHDGDDRDEDDDRGDDVAVGGAVGDHVDSPHVISIDDADLPDAVYVEGSLDRDGSRSIVIIEDDDTGDTLGPDSERDIRRGIEPRMRERRVAVKRAQGRKRLKWVAVVALVVILAVGVLAVLGSPLFAIRADRVTITGNVYADPVAVQAVIDDLVGTPSLRADTQRAERDLEAIPWVDEAKVRVDFPHAASIEIREREAWTTYQGPDQRFRVLDRDGRVLDVLDGYPFAYVLITGPDPVDLDPGEFAPRGYAAASELAKNLTGSVRSRVESIQVTADGSRLSLLLDDGTEVLFGEARDLFAKLVRLETVLTSGEERESGLIDVSTREVTAPPSGSGQDDG